MTINLSIEYLYLQYFQNLSRILFPKDLILKLDKIHNMDYNHSNKYFYFKQLSTT